MEKLINYYKRQIEFLNRRSTELKVKIADHEIIGSNLHIQFIMELKELNIKLECYNEFIEELKELKGADQ